MKTAFFCFSMLLIAIAVTTGADGPADSQTTKATYLITGLHCPPCTKTVEASLTRTKGVKSVTVDWKTKNAKIEFDESLLPAQTLAQKIAGTAHMMGGSMHYAGWLSLKVPSVVDDASGKSVQDALAKVEGIERINVYPAQHAVGIQFRSKGTMTSREVIDILAKAGIPASN